MENVINLAMGDWSKDGHNETETITIKSALSVNELEEAYKKGASNLLSDSP